MNKRRRSSRTLPSDALRAQILLIAVLFAVFLPAPNVAQESTPAFRTEAESAFVWGQDAPHGAVSSIAQDPLTGRILHKLSYNGVEVSSRLGYEGEWLADSKWLDHPYDVVISVTTVVNDTSAPVSVFYGGATADGHEVIVIGEKSSKQVPYLARKSWHELSCIQNGSVPSEVVILSGEQGEVVILAGEQGRSQRGISHSTDHWNVQPGSSRDASAVTAIQRPNRAAEYRYFVRVNNKDFVFPWRMVEAQLCGNDDILH